MLAIIGWGFLIACGIIIACVAAWKLLGVLFALLHDLGGLVAALIMFVIIIVVVHGCH